MDFGGISSKSKGFFISSNMVENDFGTFQTRVKSNFVQAEIIIYALEKHFFKKFEKSIFSLF